MDDSLCDLEKQQVKFSVWTSCLGRKERKRLEENEEEQKIDLREFFPSNDQPGNSQIDFRFEEQVVGVTIQAHYKGRFTYFPLS